MSGNEPTMPVECVVTPESAQTQIKQSKTSSDSAKDNKDSKDSRFQNMFWKRTKTTDESPKVSKSPRSPAVDLTNRDPKAIYSDYLTLDFSDVFAEPSANTHSFDIVWESSYQIFTAIKHWSYKILSLVLGIPAAILWGVLFGLMSFCHVWCFVPAGKWIRPPIWCIGQVWGYTCNAILTPICRSVNACCSRAKEEVATSAIAGKKTSHSKESSATAPDPTENVNGSVLREKEIETMEVIALA